MFKQRKKLFFFAIPAILLTPFFLFASCSSEKAFIKLSDFNGSRLGYVENSNLNQRVNESNKLINTTWESFENAKKMREALINKEIDGYPAEIPTAVYATNNYSRNALINDENICDSSYAYVINKNFDFTILKEINNVIVNLKNDETITKLYQKWTSKDPHTQEMESLSRETYHNKYNYYYYESGEPCSYCYNDKLYGFDYELIVIIANKLKFNITEIKCESLEAVINRVKDDAFGIGGGCITITEDLKNKIQFTNSYLQGGLNIVSRLPSNQIASQEEINKSGKHVGVLLGSIFGEVAREYVPNATVYTYNNLADCAQALITGKIDGYLIDEPKARYTMLNVPGISMINEKYVDDSYGFVFAKGSKYRDEFNEFFEKIRNNGELGKLKQKWFGIIDENNSTAKKEIINKISPIENKNSLSSNPTHIKYSTSTIDGDPFDFIKDGKYVGYEIELIQMFAADRGYAFTENDIYDGTGMFAIDGVTQGTTDIGGFCISITEERAKNVDFSTPTYIGGIVMLVKNYSYVNTKTFFEKISDAFYSTFVVENRWKLFLEGIGNTLLITVSSIIIGGLLGFGFYLLLRKTNNNKVLDRILKIISWIFGSLPIVVLLMIFYYVIFRSAPISSTIVSIIVFSLLFMCSTINLLRLGTKAVDKGQEEAATSLGYGKMETFFKIILPQAAQHIFPPLKDEVSSLIKATSVVGYIAATDLTKIADIVRSQTYEAFLPLIVVAIVYALFTILISFLISRINIKIDPKRRKSEKILKGIKTDD